MLSARTELLLRQAGGLGVSPNSSQEKQSAGRWFRVVPQITLGRQPVGRGLGGFPQFLLKEAAGRPGAWGCPPNQSCGGVVG